MSTGRRWLVSLALLATALVVLPLRSNAAPPNTVTIHWQSQYLVQMTLTPNYFSGFGSVKAVFGTQPAPTHGPGATGIGSGAVDFGTVLAGDDYLYKYAAHLKVTTNDPGGFNVYGEGTADFSSGSATMSLAQTLYYLQSTSGSPADSNTGFSPALPFSTTAGTVNPSTPPTINYAVFPAPIAQSMTPIEDLYYDYEMKVPPMAATGSYFVWIVYTVVPK